MSRIIRLVAAAAALSVASGCGGGSKSPGSPAALSNQRHETALEAAWRQHAEQFSHDLNTGLQALASTASTDAYQAVSNLGPLTYCSGNLDALGSPPPVYQLAYGSFAVACDELGTAASMWRDEVNQNGQDFAASAYSIRRGSGLLSRGDGRLQRFATEEPPLQGEEARQVEDWARQIDRYWVPDVERAFSSVEAKVSGGSSDPIQALWDEHSGGDASTLTACSDILGRYVKSPPDAAARKVLNDLQAGCQAMQEATGSFDETRYEQAKSQLRTAINELERYAP